MPEPDAACDHLRRDHRVLEEHLDILLAALLRLTPERIPEIQATVRELQDLAAIHFEKEEKIFYPRLRPLASGLLDRLDLQHEEVRELARHLTELLTDPASPGSPLAKTNFAPLASSSTTGYSTISSTKKTNSSNWPGIG